MNLGRASSIFKIFLAAFELGLDLHYEMTLFSLLPRPCFNVNLKYVLQIL